MTDDAALQAVARLRHYSQNPGDAEAQKDAVAAMSTLFGTELGAVLVVTSAKGGGMAPNEPLRDAPTLFVALLCAAQSMGQLLGMALAWVQQTPQKGPGIIVPGRGGNPRRGGPFG